MSGLLSATGALWNVAGWPWTVAANTFERCYFRAMGLVVSRETQHMGVPYYVDKRFEKEYRGAALDELEKAIESDYIEYLQNSCWKEKQQSKRAPPSPP